MYLPQYHQIPENDEFWGEGFTDWVTVKNAKPLFKGHQQPQEPLNDNYYDLSVKENIEWQAKLAREYGVYGFGIYHYWFNNEKNLLTKPAEIIRENKNIDINYFYAWDNISWKRSWSNVKEMGNAWAPTIESNVAAAGPSILIPYIIGSEKDWKKHYNYLLPFFKDSRYIKKNNKPLFLIFHKDENIKQMCSYWNMLAIEDGFNGINFVYRYEDNMNIDNHDLVFKYEPLYSRWKTPTLYEKVINKMKNWLHGDDYLKIYDYDRLWKTILYNAEKHVQNFVYHGGVVKYDDTPRRGKRGVYVKNSNPDKFKYYLTKLLEISSKQGKDFIFLTAWNEWGEGAILEPDKQNGYGYLKALKESIISQQ